MLRGALFITVISGGTTICENLELLNRDRAYLVCSVIASVLLFLIPEPGERRDPKNLIFCLVCVIGTYTVFLTIGPWLRGLTGEPLATGVTILLFLAFAPALFLLPARLQP